MKRAILTLIPLIFALGLIAGVQLIVGVSRNTLAAESAPRNGSNADDLSLLFNFNGVTDDGEKGGVTRREATSIHCTNVWTANVQIEVDIYQWSGAKVYTGTVTAPPDASFTFSTQNTTIYFDDVIFGEGGGIDSIFQGSGRVLTDNPNVICTAQALDPLNYPPEFVVKLPMFDRNGNPVDHQLPRPDLTIVKTSHPSEAMPGQPISYTLSYTNLGANIAAGTVITDFMPLTLTNITVNSSPSLPLEINSHYVWQAGDIFPGAGGVITVSGEISPALTADTSLLNRVVISGQPADMGTGVNEADASIDVHVPSIAFSSPDYHFMEDDGSQNVTVTIDMLNPYSPLTVHFQTSDISATAGVDYVAASGDLIFNPGQDQRTITITLLDDSLLESAETFRIILSLPVGGSLGNPINAAITIDDDEYGVFLPLIRRE